MDRRKFIKNAGLTAAGALVSPYILPSGTLFRSSGTRLVDHVVFVLFAGGIRNQESVKQQYLVGQGMNTSGNIMENMLTGSAPSSNLLYNRWDKIQSNSLASQGVLFPEMRYKMGPTGHYNGHTVAMTGNYTETGLNLNINPEFPTIFEYYRKHNDPAKSAKLAWWISEGLGPYPSLNYSRHQDYGAMYGANYLRPASVVNSLGQKYFADASAFQPDDVSKIKELKNFLDNNFDKQAQDLPGIINTREDKEEIKKFLTDIVKGVEPVEFAMPSGTSTEELTGDLINISAAWKVLEKFKPELTVVNTFNLDVCHSDFSKYMNFLHKADYGVGWLWNKIQSDPVMGNNTIMICLPEHGRNLEPNTLVDQNGLRAFDHTNDENSREVFSLIVGPPGVIKQGVEFGTSSSPIGESIDIVPTIAYILGFNNEIPSGMLSGRVLTEAFV